MSLPFSASYRTLSCSSVVSRFPATTNTIAQIQQKQSTYTHAYTHKYTAGIAGTPEENQKWTAPIMDDPVMKT